MDRKPNLLALLLIALGVALVAFVLLGPSLYRPPVPRPPTTEDGSEPQDRDSWPSPGPGPADSNVHLALGNPSGATDDSNNPDNYLLRKPYFALSYNNSTGAPNWVSWRLQASDLGSAARGQFYPDPDLPRSFKHVTPRDYTGSGFDRGHMCPRSDRSSTTEAANATFAMTNIVPQAPSVNQKAWADLEEYCRDLVHKKHQTLWIVAGPQGQGGTGTKGFAETIANGKVRVPAKCWKVLLVLDNGAGGPEDVSRVSSSTRVIAVIMPNEESVGHGWAKYRTSLQAVETLTSYRFFDRVPPAILDSLRDRVDREHIPPGRSRHSED